MSGVPDKSEDFEDPSLKAAVCRAWGAERCPEAIRRRVMASTTAGHSQPVVFRLRPLFGLAAAALVLIGIGLSWWQWRQSHAGSSSPSNSTPLAVLPASLASDLVYRHDECSLAPDHRAPGLSQDDPIELARQMRQQLNFPVLTTRLGEGWHFRGAAFCPVGSHTSAHLLYFRDGQPVVTVSVFSLPAVVWPGDHGTNCAEMANGDHPVAGFATAKAFYCVVGCSKPPMTLSEVRRLMEQLRPEIVDNTDDAPTARVTVAGNP
jgi:hypothetical protein